MCAWCRDLVTVRAALFVARRGGASGRAGSTVGLRSRSLAFVEQVAGR